MGLYGRKEKPKMPHKSKDTKSGQIPCQRQTDAFFLEQGLSRNIPAWKGIYCQQQLEISFQPVSQV